MKKRTHKITLLELIDKILDSVDLSTVTKERIVRYYMLPQTDNLRSRIEDQGIEIGTVERPTAEEVRIENNPRLKAEFDDTYRVMGGLKEDE